MRKLVVRVFLASVAFAGATPAADADRGSVWVEGENPTSINVKPNIAGWGRKEFLSGEKWLHVSIDADKVASMVPAEGVLIRYPFRVGEAGNYEIWDRIGFEFARSPFDWRLDGGDWTTVGPNELTTDLMELDFFCEVAWLKLGSRPLAEGEHSLEIRLVRSKGKDGKDERILYSSDAFCIHPGEFHPDGKTRPGEDGRDARDREAGSTVFRFPTIPADGRQAALPLNGLWEICRDDEQSPVEIASPIRALPANPHWRGIAVPGDKNTLRPDLLFAHRVWYRTRIEVSPDAPNRSWYLVFPQNNLNTTVFVNGTYCGFDKNPFARVQIDVTRAMKPGVNEVWVGIRDAWYAYTANPDDPMKLRRVFNLPRKFLQHGSGFQDFDYPVWGSPQSGILTTPSLVAAGPVYAADVFVKTSVRSKTLAAEVTFSNPTGNEAVGEIRAEAIDEATGAVARTFPVKTFRLASRTQQTVEVGGDWADPKLWWPDDPRLYRLRTTVVVGGAAIDVKETPFGFREWRAEGTKFTLNGVIWHLWGDLVGVNSNKEEWLAQYRKSGQRLTRLATAGQGGESSGWMGLSPDDALDFFDRSGVVVRRNSTLDGEAIGYNFVEKDPAIVKKQGGSELKLGLMRNVRDQFVAQIRGERNHPSIQIWSMENEFAYINLINLLGNSPTMDAYEREEQAIADAVMVADPTRTVMADGGGAFKANSMPVHGDHYVATLDQRYPDLAYEPFPEGGGRGRWRWDQERPRYIGEEFFASGINPADYAMWGGEAAFGGKAEARDAVALVYRMLMEGYRWGGHQAAWHLWLGADAPGQYASSPWRAAFCRQYDWSFGSGQRAARSFGVFNDTHSAQPLTFIRTLTIGDRRIWTAFSTHAVAPGTSYKFDQDSVMPKVEARQEGELVLTLEAGGVEVFRDVKAVSVLPESRPRSLGLNGLAVLDPGGEVSAFLRSVDVPFRSVDKGVPLPKSARVLVVGRGAIESSETTSSRLAADASTGRTVIMLEQDHPLKYQATPAGLEPASTTMRDGSGVEVAIEEGRTAFLEDPGHPAFRGLKPKDFFTWGPDHVVYRRPYVKPTRNARSLVQVGPRLRDSALVEVPVGEGLLILGQLEIGKKLASNAVARQLLSNLIDYGAAYKREVREVAAATDDPRLLRALDAIGLRYSRESDPIRAIARPEIKLAVVSATPSNLKALADQPDRVASFTRGGGYLVLHGVTPEGLADYNRIVGVEHLIRPFRRERVAFPTVRSPLTAGLMIGDIVLLSGERIFPWTADEYVASDMFQHVVDYDDVAPFGSSPFGAYNLITNGFVGADGWPLIIDYPVPQGGKPAEIVINLPRPETIVEYTHIPSINYWPTTRVDLTFDGKGRIELPIRPGNDPQTFAIEPPKAAKQITLQVAAWEPVAGKAANIGIDDIRIKALRSPEFLAAVKPMLNVGGLMHYPRGKGGIVLCNLLLKDDEAVPINATKKRAILRTILGNLKAPFSGGKTVIVGAGLAFEPVDLRGQANQFRTERGWFGDPKFTFAALPTGRQDFAGVTYNIDDFATSPVPTVVMLGGPGLPNQPANEVRGIPVGRKADALFFLQAARIDRRRDPREVRENKNFEIARYVIHYADGQEETLPIRAEVDVDDYRQKSPAALPGAQVAWTRPFEGSGLSAVAYSMQWNNPRPDVEIRAIDLLPGKDRPRGTLALLAVSAAVATSARER